MAEISTFLRYPGSKRRMVAFLLEHLPEAASVKGKFVEPFVGGGAVYFALAPKKAVLGDINEELIDLYRGIALSPERVWRLYRSFPKTKVGYRKVRGLNPTTLTLLQRSARSLFLNRTCFKGMWRHNLKGQFNIGYGGQDRRWS
jgi:DNA adenine methylase